MVGASIEWIQTACAILDWVCGAADGVFVIEPCLALLT
jgi:hypothetical protein